MRFFAAVVCTGLAAAVAVVNGPSHGLEKRTAAGDYIAAAGCDFTCWVCMGRCTGIHWRYARAACHSACFTNFIRQLLEADNELPAGIDAPAIVRREEDLEKLKGCNSNFKACVDDIVATYGDPKYSQHVEEWGVAMAFCGAEQKKCMTDAGFAKYNGFPEH